MSGGLLEHKIKLYFKLRESNLALIHYFTQLPDGEVMSQVYIHLIHSGLI